MNHSPPKDIGSRQAQQQDRLGRIAQEALRAIAATSRTVAIKDFELSHQTALEAVRMAISSRSAALSAAQQYIAGVVARDGLLAFNRHPLPTLPKSRSYPQRIRLTPHESAKQNAS